MIDVTIRCIPPLTTAQQKGSRVIRSKTGKMIPVFYKKANLVREEQTWSALLAPHVPAVPMAGALELSIKLVYPHLASTPKRARHLLIPKLSIPDAGNAGKDLEDLLAKMRFFEDDRQVSRITTEKWHGPESAVGIRIRIVVIGSEECEAPR